jgi:hypothetical protein
MICEHWAMPEPSRRSDHEPLTPRLDRPMGAGVQHVVEQYCRNGLICVVRL